MPIKIMAVIAIILILSTLICGMWIASQKDTMDENNRGDSLKFHKQIGIAATVVVVATLIMVLIKYKG